MLADERTNKKTKDIELKRQLDQTRTALLQKKTLRKKKQNNKQQRAAVTKWLASRIHTDTNSTPTRLKWEAKEKRSPLTDQ